MNDRRGEKKGQASAIFFQTMKRSTDRYFQPQLDRVQRLVFPQAGDIQYQHEIHFAGDGVALVYLGQDRPVETVQDVPD